MEKQNEETRKELKKSALPKEEKERKRDEGRWDLP